MITEQYRNSRIEALILASSEPLTVRKIIGVMEDTTPGQVARAVAELNGRYADGGSSFRIRMVAGGYQFYILPEYIGLIEELFARHRKVRLTRAALEAVAIIAYRQPTTKAEIEHIRGVASDGVIKTLLERSLITITGRSEGVGKPLQYGTTDEFLKLFGLASLNDLPQMAEIEQMISAAESRDQTELKLELDEDGRPLKLNVADGTFDPSVRLMEDEEIDLDQATDEEELPIEDEGPMSELPGRLTLVRPEGEAVEETETDSEDSDGLDLEDFESDDDFDEAETVEAEEEPQDNGFRLPEFATPTENRLPEEVESPSELTASEKDS